MYYLEVFGLFFKFENNELDNLYGKLSYLIINDLWNKNHINLNYDDNDEYYYTLSEKYDYFTQENDIKQFLKDYNIEDIYNYKILYITYENNFNKNNLISAPAA